MAPENFAADANQYDTAENFGPLAQQRADKATHHDPQRRHDKGGAADRQRGAARASPPLFPGPAKIVTGVSVPHLSVIALVSTVAARSIRSIDAIGSCSMV